MAAQLLRWVAAEDEAEGRKELEEIGLEERIADGFAVAKLLVRYGVLRASRLRSFRRAQITSDGAGAEDYLETAAANYDKLLPTLCEEVGVKLTRKEIAKVMLQEPGAAAALLFKIKCKLEPDAAPPEDSQLSLKEKNRKEKEAAALKSRAQPVRKAPPNPDMEKAVRGLLTQKQLDSALHLAHFEDRRIVRRLEADAELRQEHELLVKARAERREAHRERLREGRAFLDAWIEQGKRDWRANQRVKIDRVRRELQFELTCRARDAARDEAARRENAGLVQRGTEDFERNLKRLGVDTGDGPGASAAPLSSSSLQPRASLEAAVRDMMVRDRADVAKHLARIKAQHEESLAGRKSREQRRRKMLADQDKAQRNVEAELAREALLAKVQEEAQQERRAATARRRKSYDAKASRLERRRRARELIEHREQEFRAQVLAHQRKLEERTLEDAHDETVQEQVAASIMEREERLTRKANARAARHLLAAEDTVDLLVGLVEQVIERRAASPDAQLHPAEWRELKAAYIAGQTRPASLEDEQSTVPHISDREAAFAESEFPHAKQVSAALMLDADGPTTPLVHILQQVTQSRDSLPSLEAPFKGAVLSGFGESDTTRLAAVLQLRYGCRLMTAAYFNRQAEALRAEDEANEAEVAPVKVPKKLPPILEENRADLLRRLSYARDTEDMVLLSQTLTRLAAFDLLTATSQEEAVGLVLVDIAQTVDDLRVLEENCGPKFRDDAKENHEEEHQAPDGDGELARPRPGFLEIVLVSEARPVPDGDQGDTDASEFPDDPESVARKEWALENGIIVCSCVEELEAAAPPPSLEAWTPGQRLLLLHAIAEDAGTDEGLIDIEAARGVLYDWELATSGFTERTRPLLHRAICVDEVIAAASAQVTSVSCELLRGDRPLPGERFSIEDLMLRHLRELMFCPADQRPAVNDIAHQLWDAALQHTRQTRAVLNQVWEDPENPENPRARWLESVSNHYEPVLKQIVDHLQQARAFVNRFNEVIGLEPVKEVCCSDGDDNAREAVDEAAVIAALPGSSLEANFRQALRTVEMRALDNPVPDLASVILKRLNARARASLTRVAACASQSANSIATQWESHLSLWDEACKVHLSDQDARVRRFRKTAESRDDNCLGDLVALWAGSTQVN